MPRVKRTLPGFDLAASLSGVRIDRAQPIGPQLYAALRMLIIRSTLPSGAPLHESDIAAACAVSRTPVRAALQQLAQDGLVTTWPQVGSAVAAIDRASLNAGVAIRRALEGEVVRLLAMRPQPFAEVEARLAPVLAAQQAAADRGDDLAFFAADEAFHATLADLAGLPDAWRLLHGVKAHIDRVRLLATRLEPGRHRAAYAEHLAIVEAVRGRQGLAASVLMARHAETVLASFDLLEAAGATR
ncbi:GntR family transcriptional regulator [Azorhizobium oxalatiphilum]|uniref:GntR family transcriptional regulator n=1 Tax=Azorhizobium oxalatiphilum TaxID=980631 RepID=A0A917BYK9_9HYPH|nr:GntR family transcriptional regulator [Azorhizobium oxalatiphilum]GGF61387.1 GntR family transcriptional regulator [Azorhizobium oxalatiphilum]